MADDARIQITVCGDGGCGKSSMTLRLVRSQWTEEYDPTIEDSYAVERVVDGKKYHLSLIDTAGQEEYRGIWAQSNLRSDAFLLVYDITNAETLHALEHFTRLIQQEAEHREDSGQAAPVSIVAGNKSDLKEMRTVPSRTGLQWARQRGCGFMETSAREMVNIEETFALLVRRVVAARQQRSDMLQRYRSLASASATSTSPKKQISPPPPHQGGSKSSSPFSSASRQTTKQPYSISPPLQTTGLNAHATHPTTSPPPLKPSSSAHDPNNTPNPTSTYNPSTTHGANTGGHGLYPSPSSPHLYEKRPLEHSGTSDDLMGGYRVSGGGASSVKKARKKSAGEGKGFWTSLKCW